MNRSEKIGLNTIKYFLKKIPLLKTIPIPIRLKILSRKRDGQFDR